MTTIALEGMQFFANHGYYEEEQATNTYFIVDVYVQIGDKSMREVQLRHIGHCLKADPAYGAGVAKALGIAPGELPK